MSNNFEVKTKKTLFLNGERLTEYIWDNIEFYDNLEIIILTNDEGQFSVYSKLGGDLLYETDNHISHEIKEDYIIIKIMYIDLPLYGIISFTGKVIVPPSFTDIKETEHENVFQIEISKLVKGYYMAKNGQLILGTTQVNKANDVEYEFLIDNRWRRYSFIDGVYMCIN